MQLITLFSWLFITANVGGASCPPIANLDMLVESERRVFLLGEIHGTAEAPAFVERLVCHLLDQGREVTVGLEWPYEESERVAAFLDSAGTTADREALLAGEMWSREYQDGRNSAAMLELLEQGRRFRRAKAPFDASLFDSYVMSAERDHEMGRRLAAAIAAAPRRTFVVLTGNYHNRIRKGAPWDPDFEPMALMLEPGSYLSLDVSHPPGTAWICTGSAPEDCGLREVGGKEGAGEAAVELFSDPGEEHHHHGVFRVGSATASPPAARVPTSRGSQNSEVPGTR